MVLDGGKVCACMRARVKEKNELFDSDGLDREKQMLSENCWHLIWNSKRD
jgi:hypothetical protein